LLIVEHIAVGP